MHFLSANESKGSCTRRDAFRKSGAFGEAAHFGHKPSTSHTQSEACLTGRLQGVCLCLCNPSNGSLTGLKHCNFHVHVFRVEVSSDSSMRIRCPSLRASGREAI